MKVMYFWVSLSTLAYFAVWALVGVYADSVLLFRLTNYFGYFVPFLSFSLAGLLVVGSTKLRGKVAAVLLAVPAMVLPVAHDYPSGNLSGKFETNADEGYEVVTFSKMSRNTDYEQVKGLVKCGDYDLIVVQEFPDFESYRLAHGAELSGCYVDFVPSAAKLIVSKHPVRLINNLNFATISSVSLPSGDLLVVNLRLDKTIRDHKVQERQLELLFTELDHINAERVIIAGDFNATPYNQSILRMKRYAAYARPKGVGIFQFTFPSNERVSGSIMPFLRIDHIFYKGIGLEGVDVIRDNFGSDHYPVLARFESSFFKQ